MSERLSKERLEEIRRQVDQPSRSAFSWYGACADLLAEVDRLRSRPTEAFLVTCRCRAENARRYINPVRGGFADDYANDVSRLLAALEYTEGLLCDLLADHDLIRQEGASAERERCLAWLEEWADGYQSGAVSRAVQTVREQLPPLPPPSPPEAARRYAAALADCLRRLVNCNVTPEMIAEARKLLEGGD